MCDKFCENCRYYLYVAHDVVCNNVNSSYFGATINYQFYCNYFEEIQDVNDED